MYNYNFLLPIEPINHESGDIESLSSYYLRQAEFMMFSGHKFTQKLISKYSKAVGSGKVRHASATYYSPSSNGTGEIAQTCVAAIEYFSPLSFDFTKLTLLSWRESVNPIGNKINGPHRKWCRDCWLEDRVNNVPLYGRLVWSIEIYDVCIHHLQPMSMYCPHCGELQYAHPTVPILHLCDYCTLDLSDMPTEQPALPSVKSLWVSRSLHKLVERTCGSGVEISRYALPEVLNDLANKHTRGNILSLANALNFMRPALRDWHAGTDKPSLPRLLDLCYRLDIPPDQLLLERALLTHPFFWRRNKFDYIYTSSMFPFYLKQEVAEFLRLAVVNNPDPPLQPCAVAKQFGVYPFVLMERFPDEFKVIKKRWKQYLTDKKLAMRKEFMQP